MNCQHCGEVITQSIGAINRAVRAGRPLYCNRVCASLGRRKPTTLEEKKVAKQLYDIAYRARNHEHYKAKKRAYYQRTRDPEKERIRRKANMHKHVAYCRRPEYRQYKHEYDRQRQAKQFGEFAESWLLLRNIEQQIEERMDRYQINLTNGTINKAQTRRRAL